MSKWKKVKLEEIFILQMGKTPARKNSAYWNTGEHKWISIADIGRAGKYIENTKETISNRAVIESGIKAIPRNTVIMSFKLSIGKTCITAEEIYSNEAIMAFISNGTHPVDNTYLFHLFSTRDWSKGANKAVMGITLNKATLSNIEIPLPPLKEQERIAGILDKAAELISLRRQQIEKLDLLVKSQFIEMFGDPVTNPKGWSCDILGKLGTLNRGVSKHRPRNAPELLGGQYPLIQTGDVSNAGLYITGFTNTYSEEGLKQSYMWDAGTLCITIAANIAKTAILRFDACFPDSVVGFIPNHKTNQIYIHFWFSFFQKTIEDQAPESAQKNINLRILNLLSVIVPPLELQNKFAEFVEAVEEQKNQMVLGLEKLELNYKALMADFFGN